MALKNSLFKVSIFELLKTNVLFIYLNIKAKKKYALLEIQTSKLFSVTTTFVIKSLHTFNTKYKHL